MLKKTLLILFFITVFSFSAFADMYPSYDYMENGGTAVKPQPFYVDRVLSAKNFGTGSFEGAEDIFVDSDMNIYVSDTQNNSIAICFSDKSTKIIDGFFINGGRETFNNPHGIFVSGDTLYVCDYGNNRIVIISIKTGESSVIRDIQSKILDEDFIFKPNKIAADGYGRIYCVSDGQYNGLMVFEKDGTFSGFVGANKAKYSLSELFWRSISTRAQKKQQTLFIPTEFSNVTIDEENFIYTTTATVDIYDPSVSEPVRKQSPNGENILRYSGGKYPIGDRIYPYYGEELSGPSRFVDIAVWDNKMYSVLDQSRCRVFTYDQNGSLLFIFGGIGESQGSFSLPKAIACNKNTLYVLDSKTGAITVLSPTEYASKLITAVNYASEGDYNSALSAWSKVLEYDRNNELAYFNIAQIQLNKSDFTGAMQNAIKANNRQIYSNAFALNRMTFVGENIGYIIVSVIMSAVFLFIAVKLIKKARLIEKLKARSKTIDSLAYGGHILYAPLDGFWVQKSEKKANILSGAVIMVFLFLSFVYSVQGTGFSFTGSGYELLQLNVFMELAKTVLPVLLWCVSNWCITTLMDGSGNFNDIFKASCFSIIPYISMSFLCTFLSNFLTLNEGQILKILMSIGIVYSAFLIFAFMCSVHEYSAGRALIAIALTLIGMAVIIFISVLFFNLINKFIDFAAGVYNEIRLRN